MVNPLIRPKQKSYAIPLPNQSAGILDDFALRKTIATKQGTIEHTPQDANDILNKAFIDANFVPYTGANAAVDLGSQTLTTTGLGTFGQLAVDNIGINGNTITSTTGTVDVSDNLLLVGSNVLYIGTTGISLGNAFNILLINANTGYQIAVNGSSEIVLSANNMTFNNGAVDTSLNWSTSGQLNFRVNNITMALINGNQFQSVFGRKINTTRKTTTYTLTIQDDELFGNTDSSSWTLSLPAGTEGQRHRITNSGSSSNQLTVSPNGSEHLLGENDDFVLEDGESLYIVWNTTDGWY